MENAKENRKGFHIPRHWHYVIATAIILLSLLGFSAAFVLKVYFSTESSCYDELFTETDDAISGLEANIRSDRTMLRVIAGMIGNADDIDSIEVSGYLTNYDYNNLITQIGILLPDDEQMISKGRRSSLKGTLSFSKESIQGEHITSSAAYGSNSNSNTIRNFVPIRKDGICTALLFSSASSSNIAKAWLPCIYEKKGFCYVVDRRTGEIIINTSSDQIKDIHDISFKQTNSSYTKDGTISNILEGKKGYSVFSSSISSEKLYMCYLPFGIEDWEMVVFVPESAVFSEVSPINNAVYKMILMSVIAIIIYAIWLIREVRASINDTEKKANIDVLTGLPNRNRYEAYLKSLNGSSERLMCLFIDVNGLHELNNTKGHFAGDQMLRFIADTLKVLFSSEHIYRIGGDEFVVFQSGKTEKEIKECLGSFNDSLARNDYHAAVGKCVYEENMSVNQLIVNAEKEMYESKKKYYDEIGKEMRD